MADYKETTIWTDAYGNTSPYASRAETTRLSSALDRIYENSSQLAAQIWSAQPGFTAHDSTHCTAIWELADTIRGSDLTLNPAEVFVLGAAVFFHDLAMTLAALPLRSAELLDHPSWRDTLSIELRRSLGRAPSQDELDTPPSDIVENVTQQLLRDRHAELSGSLPTSEYVSPNDPSLRLYLIEDPDLRLTYGDLIGKLAASHGRSVSELISLLPEKVGAPHFAPISWIVSTLPLAALLRCADAAHLDAGRAPLLSYATRKFPRLAAEYWQFHQHLQRPYMHGDRLVFSTATPFGRSHIDAWWRCVDALQMVDRELKSVDDALADSNKPRLAARSVAGAQDISRIASYVKTEGWEPVDARVHIGDVVSLVSRLGGEQLYGERDIIAIRELVLNAADAINALRTLYGSEAVEYTGRVLVSLSHEPDKRAITIDDNGIGMPVSVLTGALLDFGTSFWEKPEASRLYPGLQSRGFTAAGRYGIGFFSAFMWGSEIKVTSRSYYASMEDTYVLEFRDGLSNRPIVRKADPHERRATSGTSVSICLNDRFDADDGAISIWIETRGMISKAELPLSRLLAWLIPASEVRIEVMSKGVREIAVEAGDWRRLAGADLIARLIPPVSVFDLADLELVAQEIGPNLREILDDRGQVVGRGTLLNETAVAASGPHWRGLLNGVVTVGGARTDTGITGVAGIFVGRSISVTRESAVPLVDRKNVTDWIEEEARLRQGSFRDQKLESETAEAVMRLSGDTEGLALFQSAAGWLSQSATVAWASELRQIRIVHPVYLRMGMEHVNADLDKDVVIFEIGHYPALAAGHRQDTLNWNMRYWPLRSTGEESRGFEPTNTLLGRLYQALIVAWNLSEIDAETVFGSARKDGTGLDEFGNFNGVRLQGSVTKISRPEKD